MIFLFGSNSFGTTTNRLQSIEGNDVPSSHTYYLLLLSMNSSNNSISLLINRFLDSLEIWKMKSGVHSLCIALFLLVNRQGSKQGTGMALLQ